MRTALTHTCGWNRENPCPACEAEIEQVEWDRDDYDTDDWHAGQDAWERHLWDKR